MFLTHITFILLAVNQIIFNQYGYGSSSVSIPKTILFSASPQQIIDDAQLWKQNGIDAFFLDYVAREWSSNIWDTDKKPWTIGEEDETFKKAVIANKICKELGMQTFLKIAFDNYLDWFSDILWENVIHNFRQFAWFAKNSGCNGIAIDIEYIGEQYNFDWKGYDYSKYSKEELIEAVQKRSKQIIRCLIESFPEMVFITFPEQGFSLGLIIQLTWLEELAKENLPGGFHYFLEHTYRLKDPDEIITYISGVDRIFLQLLSPKAKKYWKEKCSIAPGIWPFGYDYDTGHKPGYSPEELSKVYSIHLAISKNYNWIYSHNCYEQLLGRKKENFESETPLEEYLKIFTQKETTKSSEFIRKIHLLRERNYRELSIYTQKDITVFPFGNTEEPKMLALPLDQIPSFSDKLWESAFEYLRGKENNYQNIIRPVITWEITEPYSASTFQETHNSQFPPEIDLGITEWTTVKLSQNKISLNFVDIFGKKEQTCCYAKFSFSIPTETEDLQLRVGFNDSIKIWLIDEHQKRLIYEYYGESTVIPDKVVIPLHLQPRTYTILTKVTNNKNQWG
ncbi:MAG: hypothetical protein N3G21_05630, partial [Candidatus Hydrogenedentes bacterium]|nr:hypothetical protein [Candidatus Hydrogenedentota bacterium]